MAEFLNQNEQTVDDKSEIVYINKSISPQNKQSNKIYINKPDEEGEYYIRFTIFQEKDGIRKRI